jgi:hypothetical protein
MRAAVTTPTAPIPPWRNATTVTPTVNAPSLPHSAPNEICARRIAPLGATVSCERGRDTARLSHGEASGASGFVVRRELQAHQQRTGRATTDLLFGRTTTEAFYASTIRARANKAWEAAGLEPITPHEARHCAIS